MSAYPHPRNTSVMHASANIESVRPRSNDEARATWAAKYYSRGMHRANGKPRIRVTVPQPLCQPAPQQRTTPPPVAVARAGSFPIDKHDLPDMTPEQWEEWERAFGPEPNIPEEC